MSRKGTLGLRCRSHNAGGPTSRISEDDSCGLLHVVFDLRGARRGRETPGNAEGHIGGHGKCKRLGQTPEG